VANSFQKISEVRMASAVSSPVRRIGAQFASAGEV